ncbi:SWIM zinc finger family protein [Actinoplanes sp. CA-131856]
MAVRIDVSAFRSSISAQLVTAAEQLSRDGGVGGLEAVGGGARAVVRDSGIRFQPWVGVVDQALIGDCDCEAGSGDGDFCAHAVAVALSAFEAGVRFSAAGRPHGAGPIEPEQTDYLRAVQSLGPRQLTALVVEQAVRDRLFATLLLGKAGMLAPVDESALAGFQAVIREAANATTGTSWEIADVEEAGRRLVAEVEILCARPETPAMLDLIEQAIAVWDELAGHLLDAYYARRIDPEEISELLVGAHRDLCERLDLDPEEIIERLERLLDRCHHDTIDTAVYSELLGEAAGAVARYPYR